MPIYEYKCGECGEKFELRRSMSDSDKDIECPKCKKKAAKRVFSVFGTTASGGGGCFPMPSGGST